MRVIPALLTALAAAPLLAIAPVARADDASYLDMLRQSPVPVSISDNVRLTSGRYICALLRMYGHTGTYRAGTSGGDLIRQMTNTFFYGPEAAEAQIDAAQSELCPETLRR